MSGETESSRLTADRTVSGESGGTESATEQAPVAFAVTGGGEVGAEELAAITVALTPVAVADDGDDAAHARMAGWRRAAFIEGIGGRPSASRQDLVQGRFGLGYVGDPTSST